MSEAVHNRIAQLRAERGITRRDLATALDVHYQTVGYLERGEYSPSLHLALRIAAFFELPLEIIFSLNPYPRISETERPTAAPTGTITPPTVNQRAPGTSPASGPTSPPRTRR
jgi:putative transcriptional regulator